MVLAELEVFHSRPVAPTRRVALGDLRLPVDPAPGFGGILLGGIVAAHVGGIDPDFLPDLARLTTRIEEGLNVPQPQLRYRFQKDKIGLQRSVHRLIGQGDTLGLEIEPTNGEPTQHLLGAVYAVGALPPRSRRAVMGTIRRAITWQGPVGPELITVLAGFNTGASFSAHALRHPVEWALEVLEFDLDAYEAAREVAATAARNGTPAPTNGRAKAAGPGPSRLEIQRRYRQLLIEAHPDHGGDSEDAAQRIADLAEARRILLG